MHKDRLMQVMPFAAGKKCLLRECCIGPQGKQILVLGSSLCSWREFIINDDVGDAMKLLCILNIVLKSPPPIC